jgi:hypothetical protein
MQGVPSSSKKTPALSLYMLIKTSMNHDSKRKVFQKLGREVDSW